MIFEHLFVPFTPDDLLVLFKAGIVKRTIEVPRNAMIETVTLGRSGCFLVINSSKTNEKQKETLLFSLKSRDIEVPVRFLAANTNSDYNILLSTTHVEALNDIQEL